MCGSEIGGVAGLLLLHPSVQGTTLVHSSMLQYTALSIEPNCKNETGESWAIIGNSV